MEPLYSLLTFPQHYTDGRLHFNVVVIPRNINLIKPIDANTPAFSEADFGFETHIINQLDGLPLFGAVTDTLQPEIPVLPVQKKTVLEEVIRQMEQNDGLKISDDPAVNNDTGARAQIEKYAAKNVSIKKYLPQTYRASFNFTGSRTRFAITDDEYECIIRNKDKKLTDPLTDRKFISWGKLIAFILRNPFLAEKAGLIYKASIAMTPDLFTKGGWLFTQFKAGSPFSAVNAAVYAARIPAITEERILFAPVLFRVTEIAANNATYDAVMQEALLYNDGYAKIIHASQPVSQDLLQETDPSNPPVKDVGLRLGWDDEQLTIWGNRQLRQKDEITDLPIDAPLGVFGYKIDVRKLGDTDWSSQNSVRAVRDIVMQNGEQLVAANQAFELPTEVHPSSHGNTLEEGFWLPMYFASWNGKSMVLPDREAEEIHHLSKARVPVSGLPASNALNLQPKKVFHPYRQDEDHIVPLLYGHDYQFRIRLMDISGGSPPVRSEGLNGGQKPVADAHFRRNIKAGALHILNMTEFYDSQNSTVVKDSSILENILGEDSVLRIKRPDLSYPAVAYTGKYKDAAALLKNKIDGITAPANPDDRTQHSIGLPDPDVNTFKIQVEVKSLEMDHVNSQNGREAFILWQEKTFVLPSDPDSENFDSEAAISVEYRDFRQLDLNNNFTDEGHENGLVLPTSRELRLTFIPVVDFADDDYAAKFVEFGTPLRLGSFKAAADETMLLSPINGGLRAFYVQPQEPPQVSAISKVKLNVTKTVMSTAPSELQRLAEALDLTAHQLTLEGNHGERVQFGVNKDLRHSLSPESGSVTLSSVHELFNRWIVAVDFSLLRDWAWKGVDPDSFTVMRHVKGDDAGRQEAGSIQLKDVVNMSMLNQPQRQSSRILFLDCIDPKRYQKDFPRELSVEYTLIPNFTDTATVHDEPEILNIELPITVIPRQIPKLVAVGVALSPYEYDEVQYRFSNPRQKFLWLEFDQPPLDPEDNYFARVLASAPDPYLCRMDTDLVSTLHEDLPFTINKEPLREIIPGMTNDFAGIGIMQELIPEEGSTTTRYLLPLPDGLHAASDELFGFFTYEIRVGHQKESWSTAQGRYGRPLKVNGVQHPAPELVCHAVRGEKRTPLGTQRYVELSASHANAAVNGRNITAFPPNTSLWYSLYTQVMQADGKSFRNILVDSGPMFYEPRKSRNHPGGYMKESGNRLGRVRLNITEIGDRLEMLGLPRSNNLSAIAVEVFPMDNRWQMSVPKRGISEDSYVAEYIKNRNRANPMTDLLGQHRIYRSSTLTRITEVCCEDC